MVSDHYGYKVASYFHIDDFLTNSNNAKTLYKVVQLAAKVADKGRKGKYNYPN